jgi:site-specific DNA-cytosine methylase
VDCLTAGIPCQPYSLAGKRLGHADERALWPELVRIVRECEPALVFIENTPDFLHHFGPVWGELWGMGFELAPPLLQTASELGAPHERERVFILAAHPARQRWRQRRSESAGIEGDLMMSSFVATLPTPAARDWKSDHSQASDADLYGTKGMPLAQAIISLPTPTAVDWKSSGAAGYSTESGRHSGTTLTDAVLGAASAGRTGKLNPRLSEWMQGFPEGWMSYAPLAMPSFRIWLRRRGLTS